MAKREYSDQTPPKFSSVAHWTVACYNLKLRWCDVTHYLLLDPTGKTRKSYFAKASSWPNRNDVFRLINGVTGYCGDPVIVTEAEYNDLYESARIAEEKEKIWNVLTSV